MSEMVLLNNLYILDLTANQCSFIGPLVMVSVNSVSKATREIYLEINEAEIETQVLLMAHRPAPSQLYWDWIKSYGRNNCVWSLFTCVRHLTSV